MTTTTAYAAGVAAADKQMSAEGRTARNEADWNLAVQTMTGLLASGSSLEAAVEVAGMAITDSYIGQGA